MWANVELKPPAVDEIFRSQNCTRTSQWNLLDRENKEEIFLLAATINGLEGFQEASAHARNQLFKSNSKVVGFAPLSSATLIIFLLVPDLLHVLVCLPLFLFGAYCRG